MQLQFQIELNDDNELIHKAPTVGAGRVVIDRFILWVPKMVPKDSMYNQYIDSFMKPSIWPCLSERYDVSGPMRSSGFYQISAAIDNVRHVFIYLKNNYRDDDDHRQVENSPYVMNTYNLPGGVSLSNCRLEYGNGIFYPEVEYDSDSKVRICNDLMAYAMREMIITPVHNLISPIITACIH